MEVDGSTKWWKNFQWRKMDNLAPELLEQIFAHIPLVDLLTVHSLVCHKWRDIIRRKNFLPWKKAYFQYKIQSHLGKSEILDSIVERDKEIKLKAEKVRYLNLGLL